MHIFHLHSQQVPEKYIKQKLQNSVLSFLGDNQLLENFTKSF